MIRRALRNGGSPALSTWPQTRDTASRMSPPIMRCSAAGSLARCQSTAAGKHSFYTRDSHVCGAAGLQKHRPPRQTSPQSLPDSYRNPTRPCVNKRAVFNRVERQISALFGRGVFFDHTRIPPSIRPSDEHRCKSPFTFKQSNARHYKYRICCCQCSCAKWN